MTQKLRADQYVIAKYKGSGNGDVIAARITSVRRNGTIVLEDCMTGKVRIKHVTVLLQRNAVVCQRDAEKVAAEFELTKSKTKAREKAVAIAEKLGARKRKTEKEKPPTALFAVVVASSFPLEIAPTTGAPFEGTSLTDAEREVADTMWPRVKNARERLQMLFHSWRVVPLTPDLDKQYKALQE